jgi:hypothetical protein
MSWTGQVACMRTKRNVYKILVGEIQNGRVNSEELDFGGRIIQCVHKVPSGFKKLWRANKLS